MLIRTDKTPGDFFIMRKDAPNDVSISWKAKGILSYLMSKPPDWNISAADIVKRATDGDSSLRSGLYELERAGYLVRRLEHNPDTGAFSWVCTAYEVAVSKEERSDPDDRKHALPFVENPQVVNPQVENQHPTNNDSTNNDSTNNDSTNNECINNEKTDIQEFEELFPRKFPEAVVETEPIDYADKTARDAAIIESTEKYAARASSEPWLLIGKWIHVSNGVPKATLQRVLWLIVTVGGIPEPASDRIRKRWPGCLYAMYTEALGNWDVLERAAQEIKTTKAQYRGDISKWAEKYVLTARAAPPVAEAAPITEVEAHEMCDAFFGGA